MPRDGTTCDRHPPPGPPDQADLCTIPAGMTAITATSGSSKRSRPAYQSSFESARVDRARSKSASITMRRQGIALTRHEGLRCGCRTPPTRSLRPIISPANGARAPGRCRGRPAGAWRCSSVPGSESTRTAAADQSKEHSAGFELPSPTQPPAAACLNSRVTGR